MKEPMQQPNTIVPERTSVLPSIRPRYDAVSFSTDPFARNGRNDIDVEIFRRGELLIGFLSHVRPGDCFQKIVNGAPSGQWFRCLSEIKKSYMPSDTARVNPTFLMDGIQIMQAAPIVERPRAVLPPTKPKLSSDVEDVEFKE